MNNQGMFTMKADRVFFGVVIVCAMMIGGLAIGLAQTRTGVGFPSDLPGTYSVSGLGPSGDPYTATVEIIPHGLAYEVRWTFPPDQNGESVRLAGVGFIRDGLLVVGYGPPTGVVVYRVVTNAPLIMEGQWTMWGLSTLHSERLVKGPPPRQADK